MDKPKTFSFQALIFSSLFNLALLAFLNLVMKTYGPSELSYTPPIQATLKPRPENEILKKIRKFGEKESQKKNFTPTFGKKKKLDTISMLKPQIPSSQIEKIKKNKKTKETEKSFKDLGPKTTESQKVRQVQINNQVTQKVLKKYEPHGLIDENVLNSDFNLKPELPKGIPEDELNSIEKIYFSFQKRMFVQYLNTFITTYNKQKQRRPLLKSELQNERHRLSARVIFDKEGNIIAIKVIKSSPNDDVHDLFEQTLRNIQKVPNPPKDFINKDDEFVIYYSLNINK